MFGLRNLQVLLATVSATFCFVCLVLLFRNPCKPRNPKLRQFPPHGVILTSFFRRVKFVPPKPYLFCHMINIVDNEEMKKGNRWTKQKSVVCIVLNGCEFCLHTPSVFLGCSKSLFTGWRFFFFFFFFFFLFFFNSSYHVPKTLFLSLK